MKLVAEPPEGAVLLVFYTDPHLSDQNPESRVGDYRRDILAKLVWVWQYTKASGAAVLICGGDMFHRKAPRDTSHYTVWLLTQFWRRVGLHLVHLSLVGNHDVRHGRVEDIEHQPIGMLETSGVLSIINDSLRDATYYDAYGSRFRLVGNHANYEAEGNLEAFQFDRCDDRPIVQVVHTTLLPHSSGGIFPGVPWIRWEDFETSADIVLIGHPHTPYPAQEINGRVFVAPGSLGRESKALTHMPQIALVWVAKDECCVQYVPVAAAKPYDEVFQQAGVELEKALDDLQVKSFVEQYLAGAELTERLTFEGLTQAIREMELKAEVKELALAYLGGAHDGDAL